MAILLGVLLTPLVWFAGALMTSGGHNMTSMTILFPYMLYLIYGVKIGEVSQHVGMLLFCIQFVVYALTLATARNKRQLFYISILLLLLHALAVIFSFSAYRASEPNVHLRRIIHKA
jgi:hypothetical protein